MKLEAYEARTTAVEARIKAAWRAMHHNASLSSFYPDFRNEYEYERFWQWLNTMANFEIGRCESLLASRFGITTKIYTAGRQGATFYPELFHRHVGCNGFGGFLWDHFHKSYRSDIDELRDKENVAKALEWFNAYWKRQAKRARSQWNSHKRSHGLNKTIRSYDGKTLKTITVWA